jgi:hypothetical protein
VRNSLAAATLGCAKPKQPLIASDGQVVHAGAAQTSLLMALNGRAGSQQVSPLLKVDRPCQRAAVTVSVWTRSGRRPNRVLAAQRVPMVCYVWVEARAICFTIDRSLAQVNAG